MKNTKVPEGFDPVSAKAWKQQIQADLKGGDYNELLTWVSPEGITVRPFYTEEDLPEGFTAADGGAVFPWKVGHALLLGAPGWEDLAREALEGGVEELLVRYQPGRGDDLERLGSLARPLWMEVPLLDARALPEVGRVGIPSARWLADPIGTLVATGNWASGMEADMEHLAELAVSAGENARLAIHGNQYQNAGANRVQELAYSLAQAHEYLLRAGSDNRLAPLMETPVFLVAIGNEYFFEIAKLRALRRLWRLLAESRGFSGECRIFAQPSLRNKTLYDYNTNMLRTTMECMAAVLGGADLICNLPYDHLYHEPNGFGDRIARNQLLLLKHESHFDRVSNPADGAYYVESLTEQLGSRALDLLKNLEKGGGLLKQLREHKIQKKIRDSALEQQKAFDSGRLVLVGSNKYPNPGDRMRQELQRDPFPGPRKQKTLIEPVLPRRLSESYEQKRLRDE